MIALKQQHGAAEARRAVGFSAFDFLYNPTNNIKHNPEDAGSKPAVATFSIFDFLLLIL